MSENEKLCLTLRPLSPALFLSLPCTCFSYLSHIQAATSFKMISKKQNVYSSQTVIARHEPEADVGAAAAPAIQRWAASVAPALEPVT